MESKGASKLNFFLGIPSFWKRQQHDWKVTVARTSLERFGYQMIYPYLSIYIVALGANKTELGLITSIGMILAGLIAPFIGNRIDQTGPKKIYLLGVALLTAAYLTYSFAMTWQAAAVGMIIYFLGEGIGIHSCATICGNCLVNCDRAKGMMVCESIAAGLLGMLGPMLSAWMLVHFMGVTGSPSSASDIRPLFYVPMLTTIASFILVLTMLSNHKWVSKNSPGLHIVRDGIEILKGNRNAQKWLIIGAVTYIPRGMILPFCQVFAKEVKGADVVTLGAMVTGAALTSVLFGYPVGALADKIGRKKVLFMIIPLFWLSNILLVYAPSPAALVLAGILQGFFFISTPLSATVQRELVPPEVMGRWIGLNKLVTAIVSAGMAFISGIIYDRMGPQVVFLLYVGIDILIRIPLLASMPETLNYKIPQPSDAPQDSLTK
ncbi:MAG TPA: MFS transporter [Terriglobales bacterium]|nr:MFS transporter [Terriglobales bacterium]